MRNCCRRDFLRIGAGATFGAAMAGRLAPLWGQESPAKKAKACIVLWMAGGPSHIDTFDPKPGQATGGPFKPVETSVKGVSIGQHLPKVAAQAKHLALVRSVTSKEADHDRGTYLLHTGYAPQETVVHPAIGCVASKEFPAAALPGFVSIGETYNDAGYLGVEHVPLVVANPDDPAAGLVVPEHLRKRRWDARKKLLDAMDTSFAERSDKAAVDEDVKVRARAEALLGSKATEAFDLSKEEEAVRAAYGDSPFGRGCVLARRLVERGVRFVEVVLDGWDTHEGNFDAVQALCGTLDPAYARLVEELAERRLLDETIVLWMGEFGRTPDINGANGRDHHAACFSVVAAGGGFARGRVVGESDKEGREPAKQPVTVPNLLATVYAQLGFDPSKTYLSKEGRPIKLIDKGAPVRELLE